MPRYKSDAERITRNVAIDSNGCWNWQLTIHREGYGQLSLPGPKRALAHRFAYEALVGPIPEGLSIDHLCRNRKCVNPAHLEPVTPAENTRRSPIARAALNAVKTHCPKGHAYDDDNTIIQRSGSRLCRTCQRNRRTYSALRTAGIAVSA